MIEPKRVSARYAGRHKTSLQNRTPNHYPGRTVIGNKELVMAEIRLDTEISYSQGWQNIRGGSII